MLRELSVMRWRLNMEVYWQLEAMLVDLMLQDLLILLNEDKVRGGG